MSRLFSTAAVSAVDFRSIPLRNAGQKLQKPYGMELTDPVAVPERIRRQASRIINGETATEGEFPHQATLLNDGSHMCGASIIADGWALTAGHCVDGQYVLLQRSRYIIYRLHVLYKE